MRLQKVGPLCTTETGSTSTLCQHKASLKMYKHPPMHERDDAFLCAGLLAAAEPPVKSSPKASTGSAPNLLPSWQRA